MNIVDQVHPMSIQPGDIVWYPAEQKSYMVVEFDDDGLSAYSFVGTDEWGENEILFFGDDEIVMLIDEF